MDTVVVIAALDVVEVEAIVEVVVCSAVDVVVVDVVDAVVVVEALAVVDELQDANISDVTMRRLSAIQIIPFFILPPLINIQDC